MATGLYSDATRVPRTVLLMFAIANVGYLVFDAIRLRPFPWVVLVARLILEAALLGGLVSLRGPPARQALLLRFTACVITAAWVLLCSGTGGSMGGYFALVPAIPLLYVATSPDDPRGAVLLGAVNLLAGLALLHSEGAGAARQLEWGSISLFLGFAAFFGGLVGQKRMERELAAERARSEALERLAMSERRRAVAERLAMVGQLAAGVAHEINNPLGYVKSNLQWLADEAGSEQRSADPESRSVIAESQAGLARIAEIVKDLRMFTREPAGDVESFEVADLVDEALRIASVRLRTAAKVIRRVPPKSPRLRASRHRLLQVLVNLLVNAADAVESRAQGSVREQPWVRVEVALDGEFVVIEVEDSGPGLPPQVVPHLFEPFFTTKGSKGTGLGLALSRENVENCGGTLEGGNGAEGGALFRLRIPAVPGGASAGKAARPG